MVDWYACVFLCAFLLLVSLSLCFFFPHSILTMIEHSIACSCECARALMYMGACMLARAYRMVMYYYYGFSLCLGTQIMSIYCMSCVMVSPLPFVCCRFRAARSFTHTYTHTLCSIWHYLHVQQCTHILCGEIGNKNKYSFSLDFFFFCIDCGRILYACFCFPFQFRSIKKTSSKIICMDWSASYANNIKISYLSSCVCLFVSDVSLTLKE